MKAEVRDTGPLQKEISIEVAAEDVGRFIDELVAAYRQRYSFRGYRPGKAPDGVVRSRFQEEIEAAVHGELVPRSIEQALSENGLHPAAPGEVSGLRYRPGEALRFLFRVEIWPEIDLKSYDGLEVEQFVTEVTDADLDRYLEMLREQVAEETTVERAAVEADLVVTEIETVDADGKRVKGTKKEKVTLRLDAPGLLSEFRDAGLGARAGDERRLRVAYPEDYQAEELKGQTRHYRMRVLEIREKKIPPLDDAFAEKVSAGSDLEALRARVRLRLESEARMAARERLEVSLVDRLLEENPFDLPAGAIERPLDRARERFAEEGREVSEEELRTVYRPQVERLRRREFILAKVAEREGIRVTDEDLEDEIGRMAREQRRTVEEVRGELGEIERFRDFLFERRVFEALIKKVKVREVKAPPPPPGTAPGAEPAEEAVVDAEFPEDAG